MLIIYPFHAGDQDTAVNTAHWIAHLDSVHSHQCLIVHDKFADPQIASDIENVLSSAFRHVVRMPLREGAPGVQGANLLFRRAARQVAASEAGPFLWMNPDAIPIREGWLDAIEAAWNMLPRGKRFLGCYSSNPVPHMAAVGVYPQDAEVHAANLVMADNNPFHLNAAPQVVPKMAHTVLISESHISPLLVVREGELPSLPEHAVLWHGSPDCKEWSLIQDLHKLKDAGRLTALPIVAPKPETQANGAQQKRFMVPEKPITQDAAARRAVSMAGSEGIPSEELDTGTQVSGMKPPTVSPIAEKPKSPEVIASNALDSAVTKQPAAMTAEVAAGAQTVATKLGEAANAQKPPAAEDVEALCSLLAKIRDNSPADKARVLAALRASGFPITGKQKRGARR
jgi:hypothetical protein